MALSHTQRCKIIEMFQLKAGDTGSPEVQIALSTAKIFHIAEHIKLHGGDLHCRRGLERQRSARKSLLEYLKRKSPERYQAILGALELRR